MSATILTPEQIETLFREDDMSHITWALNAHRETTVFCNYCRAVFARNITVNEASEVRNKAQANHHCTPSPPWRPGGQA